MLHHKITIADINRAHAKFEENEPRGLFYRAATELVALALQGKTNLTVPEALSILLQTWNRAYYRYRKFDKDHIEKFESLWAKSKATVAKYRAREIDSAKPDEEAAITHLFQDFEKILGPVGAAKSLHLLAPHFFPIWDRTIAKACGVPLKKAGLNGNQYWSFMLQAKDQYHELQNETSNSLSALKLIDEFNYCRHTKNWI